MFMQDNPAVTSPNPYKKWVFVLLIILVIVAAGGLYFYSLVRDNVDTIESGQTAVAAYFDTEDDPYKGNPDASIVIVEFSDFQCPFCFQAFPVVRELMNTYSQQVKFVYRDFPITQTHPQAQKAAEAGECAQAQGRFWEMHDKLFINQADLSTPALKQYAAEVGLDTEQFNECLDNDRFAGEVQQDFIDGVAAGVTGTPTFFINGRPFTGAITYENFAQIIEQLIAIDAAEQ